ncbi:MAG: hypothetical protein KatS3mg023_3879 [Armatimonadota bacterium]|nr:MAG: hypothetical protein KatS3mg023_3879 [Armatimonadota bacterium]
MSVIWRWIARILDIRWKQRRTAEVLRVIRSVYPNQPYVLYGRWSWTDRENPIQVDILFPYIPVAVQILSWYDVDRRTCQLFCGDYEDRVRRLNRLVNRALAINLPFVQVRPDETPDEEWVRRKIPSGELVSIS